MNKRVVAVLESMWDWRAMTSGAGYTQAPAFFRINRQNYSGRRLYKLIGPDVSLLVTNACKELVRGPNEHGTPDPVWLHTNLSSMRDLGNDFQVLLVCGRVAQNTYERCGYEFKNTLLIPHPAARMWTHGLMADTSKRIAKLLR